ncbi:hypothetical protein Hypma_001434 [Hypsizygus marmoreus]|uniref:Uncharacterized protein n=1 Tax=Hypsizygus marmoreus TaxID=39966 RepID=A0A369K3Y7_HYPMA|nr:hypothetical protein Hypma_001434 [Hypsizygus marmoreus]
MVKLYVSVLSILSVLFSTIIIHFNISVIDPFRARLVEWRAKTLLTAGRIEDMRHGRDFEPARAIEVWGIRWMNYLRKDMEEPPATDSEPITVHDLIHADGESDSGRTTKTIPTELPSDVITKSKEAPPESATILPDSEDKSAEESPVVNRRASADAVAPPIQYRDDQPTASVSPNSPSIDANQGTTDLRVVHPPQSQTYQMGIVEYLAKWAAETPFLFCLFWAAFFCCSYPIFELLTTVEHDSEHDRRRADNSLDRPKEASTVALAEGPAPSLPLPPMKVARPASTTGMAPRSVTTTETSQRAVHSTRSSKLPIPTKRRSLPLIPIQSLPAATTTHSVQPTPLPRATEPSGVSEYIRDEDLDARPPVSVSHLVAKFGGIGSNDRTTPRDGEDQNRRKSLPAPQVRPITPERLHLAAQGARAPPNSPYRPVDMRIATYEAKLATEGRGSEKAWKASGKYLHPRARNASGSMNPESSMAVLGTLDGNVSGGVPGTTGAAPEESLGPAGGFAWETKRADDRVHGDENGAGLSRRKSAPDRTFAWRGM